MSKAMTSMLVVPAILTMLVVLAGCQRRGPPPPDQYHVYVVGKDGGCYSVRKEIGTFSFITTVSQQDEDECPPSARLRAYWRAR